MEIVFWMVIVTHSGTVVLPKPYHDQYQCYELAVGLDIKSPSVIDILCVPQEKDEAYYNLNWGFPQPGTIIDEEKDIEASTPTENNSR